MVPLFSGVSVAFFLKISECVVSEIIQNKRGGCSWEAALAMLVI